VDLVAEEYGGGQLLGNFPQAFSHVGLVNAAWAIAQAEHGQPMDRHNARRRTARVRSARTVAGQRRRRRVRCIVAKRRR
jgi:hypothetical protein